MALKTEDESAVSDAHKPVARIIMNYLEHLKVSLLRSPPNLSIYWYRCSPVLMLRTNYGKLLLKAYIYVVNILTNMTIC
jgi:hypothetical protein